MTTPKVKLDNFSPFTSIQFAFFLFTHSINAIAQKLQLTFAFSSRNFKQARALGGEGKEQMLELHALWKAAVSRTSPGKLHLFQG